jgi:predicted permease
MRAFAYFRSLAGKFFRPSQTAADLEEELRSHIQLRADDLERSGLRRAEAERRARIEFGGHARFKEECHEALGGHRLETFVGDVRFSLRVLRKSPGFTFAAVATLALGIGANAVVFGVLNALILRPLNVPRADSLYGIEMGRDKSGYQSYPNYLDLRDRNRSFDALAAYNIQEVGLDTGDNPASVWGYEISGNYFDALEIHPYLGRFFRPSDENGPNSAPYLVISYAYWHNHFQEDRGAVGRVVRLNKHPFTIVGVTPPEFHGTLLFFTPDFFVPLVDHQQMVGNEPIDTRGTRWIFATIGHLKPRVTPEQAVADLNSIGTYLEKTYPKDDGQMNFALGRPSLYGDFLGGPVRAFVTALMLLAGLILLAACANLGSLFAARAADRSRQIALRLALGASRGRILSQLFTEAILISLAGGALGLWASVLLLQQLSVWQPFSSFPISIPVSPDGRVYAAALVLALLSGFLFGLVPVRQVLRTDPYQIVKSGSTGVMGRRITVRDLLLAVQIALCAVLVTSSMVAVRGLMRSLGSDFGFEPRGALLVNTDLNMAGYGGDKAPAMQRSMIDAMAAIPGVRSVGLISQPPLNGGVSSTVVFTDTTADLRASNAAAQPFLLSISPEYFQAAGTALLAGRTLSWHDDVNSGPVAVVTREFARELFGSVPKALGAYFKRRNGKRIQVVGVVEDGKFFNVAEDPRPAIFLSVLQSPENSTWLVLRSERDPLQLAGAAKSALRNLDSGLPVFIETWNKGLDLALFPSRMATISLGVLGVMGAMLSITGIFGMAAYSVSKRLRELGIRIALGAQRKEVLSAALGRAVKLLAFGSAAGLVLGVMASRVLAFIVYQATPRDPMVLAGVVLAMLLLGLVATWIPARRALAIDPMVLLREE